MKVVRERRCAMKYGVSRGVCVCEFDDVEQTFVCGCVVCVCTWKMVFAVATTLKGGVSSTALCAKMASRVARWNHVEPDAGSWTVART